MKIDKFCIGCDECNRKSPLFASLTEEELILINRNLILDFLLPMKLIGGPGAVSDPLFRELPCNIGSDNQP